MGRGCGEVLLLSKGTDPHSHDEKKPEKKNILLLHYVFETKARLLWGLRDQPEDKYAAAPLQTDCLKKILLLSAEKRRNLRQTYSERQESTVSNQFDFLRGYVENNSNCRSQHQWKFLSLGYWRQS